MKTCTKCGVSKELAEFSTDSRRKDGRQVHCRVCVAENTRRWYAANREAAVEGHRRWREANRDAQLESQRLYREANREAVREARRRWAEANPLHNTWTGMLARCENPNAPRWKNYGGRGIKVCKQWHDYGTFVADIEALIGPRTDGMTLDRIDNDGNYEPGNVRWATYAEQNRNRRQQPITAS